MANLLLTTDCQRNCPYCFAQEDKNKRMNFEWENFVVATEFIATGPKALNLLGGEPTLHPDFSNMLAYLIENNFMVQVFTNGMLKKQTLDEVISILNKTSIREEQLIFAVNINEEKYRSKEEKRLQERFLDFMGHLTYPSFTIYEKDTSLLFLQKLIEKYNLDRTIRIGLSMPVIGGNNKYLPIELYKNVAISIIELTKNSPGTTITLDCGFPLCMFGLDEINELNNDEKNNFAFNCGQPLDIYPDLNMTSCYPLSKLHKVNMSNFTNILEAYKYFEEGFAIPTGIYGDKCKNCTLFKKICSGGCKGFYNNELGDYKNDNT